MRCEYGGLNETSLVAKTGAVPDFCWVAPLERGSPHRYDDYISKATDVIVMGTLLKLGRKNSMRNLERRVPC